MPGSRQRAPLLSALTSGHWPSLVAAWLHFEVSFMVWILVGALSVLIAQDFGLNATQKGLLVAVPLLGGALLRVPIGVWTDQIGPRTTGLVLLAAEAVTLLWGWLGAGSYPAMLLIGLLLGVAGASFAVALPLASRAYPPAHQGVAMGVAASANSGTVLAVFFAPRLAQQVGWHAVFGLMLLPVLLTLAAFMLMVPRPVGVSRSEARAGWWPGLLQDALRQRSMYWLAFLYAVTFGGFVGFCSFLPLFVHDQYGVDVVTAGSIAALCGLAGSAARPVGGYWADRLGGVAVARGVFGALVVLMVGVGLLLPLVPGIAVMTLAVGVMGFGNGVVFQVVSERFHKQMGVASGLIGAAGGLGGSLVPVWLGGLKDLTGSYRPGLWLFAGVALIAGVSAVFAHARQGAASAGARH